MFSFNQFLHLFIFALGAVAFAVMNLDAAYAEKMRKLEEVSTVSMASMVYIACPMALLLSMASQVVYRLHCDPWKDQVRMLPRILLGLQASAKERDCPDNFCQGAGGLRTSRKSERKENIFRVYRKLILTV